MLLFMLSETAHASPPVDDALLEQYLQQLGHQAFRPWQKDAIKTLVEQGKLLLVAPTGGGKSLCYQLPALLLGHTTLVISPLIALMQDQVDALNRRQIPATYFASTLAPDDMRERMQMAYRGAYRLIYAAPERLQFEGFQKLLHTLQCPLVAIDEAHCISEWGHDFRPEYLKIGEFVQSLPKARLLACTATATPVVRDEILTRLNLCPETPQIVRGFARPNLALRVMEIKHASQRRDATDALLQQTLGAPNTCQGTAIVYAPSRKGCEEEAVRLKQCGWRSDAYHAGLSGETREAVQRAFLNDGLDVVVATNAFGMGIDRADVRAVVHLAPPGSIESYYQEVGRAGRDGKLAYGLLCTAASDLPMRRHLIERPSPTGEWVPQAVIEHKWNLFLELMRWAEGGTCRHDGILRYFGDEAETLSGCQQCDVCQMLAEGKHYGIAGEEAQLIVRKALSAVARVHNRFGLSLAVKLLQGVPDPRLKRSALDSTRTFGLFKEESESWLTAVLRRCVTAGWVDFTGGNRPLVVLTDTGRAVMKAEREARILLPATSRSIAKMPRTHVAASQAPELDALSTQIFEALRLHRAQLAQKSRVPPYVVASDRTLRDLATLRPRNLQELKLAHGIGPAKLQRFGPGFLQIIARHRGLNAHRPTHTTQH